MAQLLFKCLRNFIIYSAPPLADLNLSGNQQILKDPPKMKVALTNRCRKCPSYFSLCKNKFIKLFCSAPLVVELNYCTIHNF